MWRLSRALSLIHVRCSPLTNPAAASTPYTARGGKEFLWPEGGVDGAGGALPEGRDVMLRFDRLATRDIENFDMDFNEVCAVLMRGRPSSSALTGRWAQVRVFAADKG